MVVAAQAVTIHDRVSWRRPYRLLALELRLVDTCFTVAKSRLDRTQGQQIAAREMLPRRNESTITRRFAMHVRVVRFTDVTRERMDNLEARVREAGGPPPGVPSVALTVLFDESQGTAVVLQYFANAEDLATGAKVFDAMDSAETPGARASVDACEVKLELKV
jgi:hypothetical protein